MKIRQEIKNCFFYLCIPFAAVGVSAISPATVFAQANCVCTGCGRACNDIPALGHKPGCPQGPKSAQGGSNQGSTSGGGQDMKSQMLETIVGAALQSLFSSPDNSKQEQLDKEKKLADEQARQKALREWQQLQSEGELKKKMEAAARMKQGEKVLSKLQTLEGGSGGKLVPISIGNPDFNSKPENREDDLVRLAREQLQAADQEITLALQAEKDGLNKKEQLGKEYNNLQSR
jgi:hypothetical protein